MNCMQHPHYFARIELSKSDKFHRTHSHTHTLTQTLTHGHAKSTAIHTNSFRHSTLRLLANIHMFGSLIFPNDGLHPTTDVFSWRFV